MNPSTLTRIQTFIEETLQPAFVDLKELLENPQQTVNIAHKADTGIDAVDSLLRQMHSDKPYFSTILNSSSFSQESSVTTQTWIGDSLSVEILKSSETALTYLGQYCLSIEISVTPSEQIQTAFIIGCVTPGNKVAQVRSHIFEDTLEIEEIDSSEIILLCSESFESFQSQILAPEKILGEAHEIVPTIFSSSPSFISSNPEQSIFNETSSEPQQIETSPLTSVQTLYDLSKQLTQALAPQGFPIYSTLNPKLPTPAQIKPIQDRYGRTIDLSLEYSPAITAAELTEYLHRLGHYQTLKHLAHLHIFIQEQMQAWFQQNGQPSTGAIAPHLQDHIIKLRDHLHERIQTLTDDQIDSTAQALKLEVETLRTEQQQQQNLLDRLEQNPLLGYLDIHLLDQNRLKHIVQPFTDSNQPIDIKSQHYKAKNSRSILSHIAPCQSEKYSAYHYRKQERPELKLIIDYAITQKLYPQRPVFIGLAPKAVYPRLELLWGQTDDSIPTPNPLNQIWCIYPMLRTDPPQWLIIAATTDTQPLRTIHLENGQLAEEGTYEYLIHSLQLMAQSVEEYTQALSKRVTEALEHRRIKYLHIHQTQDYLTRKPRDILQMQFQIFA